MRTKYGVKIALILSKETAGDVFCNTIIEWHSRGLCLDTCLLLVHVNISQRIYHECFIRRCLVLTWIVSNRRFKPLVFEGLKQFSTGTHPGKMKPRYISCNEHITAIGYR